MSETYVEQLSRVGLMADDDNETWDLSPNDKAAITAILQRLAALTAENNRLLTVLREVSEYLDGSNYATDSGDLPDTVRAALASPEAPQSSG